MNMQQMMIQAQKIQRELKKAQAELDAKEFKTSKSGMVEVTMLGSKKITKITIDKDAMDVDNKEMVEEAIALAVNELIETIDTEKEKLEESITGRAGGFGF